MTSNATEAEATEVDVTIEHEGDTFTVPADPQEWSIEALEAFEAEKATAFLSELLGEQYVAWKRAKPRKVRDLEALADAIIGALGLGN